MDLVRIRNVLGPPISRWWKPEAATRIRLATEAMGRSAPEAGARRGDPAGANVAKQKSPRTRSACGRAKSGQIEALLDSTNALDQLVDLHLMPGIGFVTRVDFA